MLAKDYIFMKKTNFFTFKVVHIKKKCYLCRSVGQMGGGGLMQVGEEKIVKEGSINIRYHW